MQLDRTVFNDRDKNAIGSGQKCNWIGQCLINAG
jgi:hypothetical protein